MEILTFGQCTTSPLPPTKAILYNHKGVRLFQGGVIIHCKAKGLRLKFLIWFAHPGKEYTLAFPDVLTGIPTDDIGIQLPPPEQQAGTV